MTRTRMKDLARDAVAWLERLAVRDGKAARAAEAYEEKAIRLIAEATRLLRDETPPPPSSTLRRILKVEEALRLASGEGQMAAAARRVLATIHVQLAFYQTQELFQAKDYRRARPAFEVAVEAAPEDPVARYNLACTRARTGAADEALASLARALELGLPHLLQLETDPDLASLRARPGFAPLLERARALAATPGK